MAQLNHTPLLLDQGSNGALALARPHGPINLVRNHRDRHYHPEPAMVAQVPIEDALRLDVMILPFDPNLERIETVDSDIPISAEVRGRISISGLPPKGNLRANR